MMRNTWLSVFSVGYVRYVPENKITKTPDTIEKEKIAVKIIKKGIAVKKRSESWKVCRD